MLLVVIGLVSLMGILMAALIRRSRSEVVVSVAVVVGM